MLTVGERQELAYAAVSREFRKGQVIARQGDTLATLMLVGRGAVSALVNERDAGRLAPGDCFGRTHLWTDSEPATLTALTDVTIYEIDDGTISAVLGRRPILAEKLAETFMQRGQVGNSDGAQALEA